MVALQYSVLQSDMMPVRGIGYTCDVNARGAIRTISSGGNFITLSQRPLLRTSAASREMDPGAFRSHRGPYKKGELIGFFVMSTEFLHWLLVTSPLSLARAKYFRDFIPTRDRSLSRSSLFSFKDMTDESDMYNASVTGLEALRRYTGWLFGEIDFVGVLVLRETISVEEKLEVGGLSFLLNNYLLSGRALHVMAQSPGIYNILAKTFKVIQFLRASELYSPDFPGQGVGYICEVVNGECAPQPGTKIASVRRAAGRVVVICSPAGSLRHHGSKEPAIVT
ncbi:hypothetical protein DFH09DRAFT_1079871 [Mycena vulgaris]|nr:hypothetical protein DFH09DRAFT_1079871 [Mycena vulgaris]